MNAPETTHFEFDLNIPYQSSNSASKSMLDIDLNYSPPLEDD